MRASLVCAALGLGVGLCACQKSQTPTPVITAEMAPVVAPAKTLQPKAAISTALTRDPFHSFLDAQNEESAASRLVSLPISSFALVGIAKDASGSFALVQDPLQNGYILHVGTRIGNQSGVVVRISEDAVTVREDKSEQKLEFSDTN